MNLNKLKIGETLSTAEVIKVTDEELDELIKNYRDQMVGGKGDAFKPEDFDREQLKQGITVELEHGVGNKMQALEITIDHLAEHKDDPKRYYDNELFDEDLGREQTTAFVHGEDNILQGLTLDEVVLTTFHNEKVRNESTVKKVFKELIDMRVEDAKEELQSNMGWILKELKGRAEGSLKKLTVGETVTITAKPGDIEGFLEKMHLGLTRAVYEMEQMLKVKTDNVVSQNEINLMNKIKDLTKKMQGLIDEGQDWELYKK